MNCRQQFDPPGQCHRQQSVFSCVGGKIAEVVNPLDYQTPLPRNRKRFWIIGIVAIVAATIICLRLRHILQPLAPVITIRFNNPTTEPFKATVLSVKVIATTNEEKQKFMRDFFSTHPELVGAKIDWGDNDATVPSTNP